MVHFNIREHGEERCYNNFMFEVDLLKAVITVG